MKKVFKVLLSILLVIVLIVVGTFGFVTFYHKDYKEADDTAFKVLQITDVHILNDEKKDAKVYKTVTAMVETTQPDMIMLTGDLTSEKENFTAFKSFCSFLEDFNIPWAFVFGNHEGLDIPYEENEVIDPEKIADKQTLSDSLESLPNCIYEAGDENVDGMGNYYYNVTDDNGKVITSLIMMDSHSYDNENNGYDHFHDNQIEWYKIQSRPLPRMLTVMKQRLCLHLHFSMFLCRNL